VLRTVTMFVFVDVRSVYVFSWSVSFIDFHTLAEMIISYHFGLKGEENVSTSSVSFYILPLFAATATPPPQQKNCNFLKCFGSLK
jgi:hypothetical protein